MFSFGWNARAIASSRPRTSSMPFRGRDALTSNGKRTTLSGPVVLPIEREEVVVVDGGHDGLARRCSSARARSPATRRTGARSCDRCRRSRCRPSACGRTRSSPCRSVSSTRRDRRSRSGRTAGTTLRPACAARRRQCARTCRRLGVGVAERGVAGQELLDRPGIPSWRNGSCCSNHCPKYSWPLNVRLATAPDQSKRVPR